jgi:DNA polymerase V
MFGLVDCNNFYASCERVFQPNLEGKPVVVLSNNDGIIIARSNEAKELGIKMGDPAFLVEEFLAKNNIAVFSSNYALYGDISERVHNTLAELVEHIEIYSIDEAFLDFSGMKYYNINDFATNIRKTVKRNVGIPVSVGIGPTKTLSKVANRIAKKEKHRNGVFVIDSEELILESLAKIGVEDVWGVGRQYSKLLRKHGINTALDLRNANLEWIRKHMTVMGARTVSELRGISCIPLEMVIPAKKGICTARSFGKMLTELSDIKQSVATHAQRCAEKLRKQNSFANILTVFVETNRFREDLRQYNNYKVIHMPVATNFSSEIIHYAIQGLSMIFREGYQYKKAGVMVSGIVPQSHVQGDIFDPVDREKQKNIMEAYDRINKINGRDQIRYAVQGVKHKWRLRQERLSPCFTTRWNDLLTVEL